MTTSEDTSSYRPKPSLAASRVGEIDLLRFIAAMLVVLFHYTFRGHAASNYSLNAYPAIAPLTKYGYLGVELFFLISGFVILMTASSGSLQKFVASRVARLYPAFWVCCMMTFSAILFFGNDRFAATVQQFLVNLTMLHEFVNVRSIDGVYWSLAVELKFYFLVALVLLFRQIERAEWFLGLWLVASIILEFIPVPRLRSWLIIDYAPYFAAGAICFLAYSRGWSWSKVFIIGVALVLALLGAMKSIESLEKTFSTAFDIGLIALLTCGIFGVMVLVASKKTAFLARRSWLVVGALTYPLYLIHQYIGYMLLNAMHTYMNVYVALCLVVTFMLFMAYAVNRLIEKPFSKPLQLFTGRALAKISILFTPK